MARFPWRSTERPGEGQAGPGGSAGLEATAPQPAEVRAPVVVADRGATDAPTTLVHRGDVADPRVVPRAPVMGGTGGAGATGPEPLLSRRAAAEVGMYVGAGLMALSMAGAARQGWPHWVPAMHVGIPALGAVALLATALFVRLPWRRRPGDSRRRAVSALLVAGVALSLCAALQPAPADGALPGYAAVAVAAMLVTCGMARSPLSEVALLGAVVWLVWLVVPSGPARWAGLLGLGVAWVALGVRGARGRRTAVASGTALALAAAVGLAQGTWAWPVRSVLAGLVVLGLVVFVRGGPAHWLALAAAAAAALAAAVAGVVLGPMLALLGCGLAILIVSGVALRTAREAAQPPRVAPRA